MSLPQQKARYLARATGCYFGKAQSGNVQVFVPFSIIDPEFAGERITWPGTFGAGKSSGFTIDALRALGWTGDDLSELEDLDPEGAARLLPNDVELSCDVEEYDGEWRLKVKWVNVPGGGRLTKDPLIGGDLKAFAAQMRGTLRQTARPQAAGQTQQRQAPAAPRQDRHPNAPPVDDKDIPF